MYIDTLDFAKNRQTIHSTINVATLERACDLFDELNGNIEFTLRGEINPKNRAVLIIRICGKISTSCQNCLNIVEIPIDTTMEIQLFGNEDELAVALTDNDTCDGIVTNEHFNVLDFIEDEIIMILPIAPKHENCVTIHLHHTN